MNYLCWWKDLAATPIGIELSETSDRQEDVGRLFLRGFVKWEKEDGEIRYEKNSSLRRRLTLSKDT
jgi:hypothetical protein